MSRRALLATGSVFERRAAERHAVEREGWLRSMDAEIVGVVVIDISSSGAGVLLLAARGLEAGDAVEVALEMISPDAEVWLPFVVRWRSGDRVGLTVAAMTPRQRAALAKLPASIRGHR